MILTDIELCNNLIFLIHKSLGSILLKSHDHFWCGLAEFARCNYDAAEIRLEQIQRDDPAYIATLLIQQQIIKIQNSLNSADKYKQLDAEVKEARGSASSIELEMCAIAWYGSGKRAKAVEYLEKSLKKHGADVRTLCLRAAFETDEAKVDRLIEQIPEDTNSALGKYFLFESHLKARQHSQVQKELEKLIQINSNYSSGYVQLCKAAFGVQDWDVLNTSASWLISVCPQYYDAHIYLALESLFSVQSDQCGQDRVCK